MFSQMLQKVGIAGHRIVTNKPEICISDLIHAAKCGLYIVHVSTDCFFPAADNPWSVELATLREEMAAVRARERGFAERLNGVEGRLRAAEEQATQAVQRATEAQQRVEAQQIVLGALRSALVRTREALGRREERRVVAAVEDRGGAEMQVVDGQLDEQEVEEEAGRRVEGEERMEEDAVREVQGEGEERREEDAVRGEAEDAERGEGEEAVRDEENARRGLEQREENDAHRGRDRRRLLRRRRRIAASLTCSECGKSVCPFICLFVRLLHILLYIL